MKMTPRFTAAHPPMNVAYIINTYPMPSHSFIRREIHALERQGLKVQRFAMRGATSQLVDPADIAEDDRTEHVLELGGLKLLLETVRQAFASPGRTLAAAKLAIKMSRRSEAGLLRHLAYFVEACHIARRCKSLDINHLHAHFGTNSATVAMLTHVLSGLPYSFTVHGPEEFDKPVAIGLAEKIKRAAFTVAVSSYGRSQLYRWTKHEDWDRIHVVHCGVEPQHFSQPEPFPDSGVRLVSVGRLVEQKGQLLLLEAVAQLRDELPNLHLTIVGDGDLRQEVDATIKANGLEGHVTVTGWVDERRVRAELAAAHALVLPSFAEGLPVVAMEAMAAGRPVIATYIAGLPELVEPGKTGWLVPAGNVSALAATIRQLAKAPVAQLATMGLAGRARVLLAHNSDTEAVRLATLVAAVLTSLPIV